MLRTKRKNKGKVKTMNYRNMVHYEKYNNSVISFLDETNSRILGNDVVNAVTDMPDPTLNDKRVIECIGLGLGSTSLISINNRWRCLLGHTTLASNYTSVSLPAPKNTKQIMRQFTIPRLGGKSLMQPGDLVRIFVDSTKTGVANVISRSFFFGSTGVLATDVEIDLTAASSASAVYETEVFEFFRLSDSGGNSRIMKNLSKGSYAVGLGGTQGPSVLEGETITIPNMDVNDTFVSYAVGLDGTSDSFVNNNWHVELINSGP